MFTLTWITEKELERVIENKGDEFRRKKNMKIQSGGEKMRNASGQQGENERQWKIKANMNTGNKILGKHIGQFLQKIMCNSEVWRFSRAKQRQGKDKLQVQFVLIFFLLDLLVLKPYSFFVYKYH